MEKIRGYIDHIIFRNAENGYSVLELVADGEAVTCVGNFQAVSQGDTLEIEGEYTEHPVYGSQLKMMTCKIAAPEDAADMERYLASGAIKGIGAAIAARIVKKFGDQTFRIIEEEPERLAEIKGISEKKAREIGMQAEEKKKCGMPWFISRNTVLQIRLQSGFLKRMVPNSTVFCRKIHTG